MPDICGVLLVVAEGDPRGFLSPGPCGARAPVACNWGDELDWFPDSNGVFRVSDFSDVDDVLRMALVLAWGGKLVWQGWAAIENARDLENIPRDAGPLFAARLLLLGEALATSPALHRLEGFGTVVLIDNNGHEVER